jgi:hypothetical protein
MPADPQRPIVIRTLGDFLANPGHGLSAHCPSCQHSEPLDVRRLVERYGGDIEPREIAHLLRCRQCDRKDGDICVSTVGHKPRL